MEKITEARTDSISEETIPNLRPVGQTWIVSMSPSTPKSTNVQLIFGYDNVSAHLVDGY